MEEKKVTRKADSEAQQAQHRPAKKAYIAPKLMIYGAMSELTTAGTRNQAEDSSHHGGPFKLGG
jgi:hypothetical protein